MYPVPLWALSSLSKGGLAYSSKEVGFVISFTGVPMVLFTVLIFPALSKRLGTIRGFQWGFFLTSAFGIGVMLSPLLCDWVLPTWLPMLPVLLFMTSCAKMASCMAFTSTFLIINAAVPSNLRGTVNGLAMTFGSIAKALGPSVGSVIFASAIHSSLPLPLSYLLVFLMNFAIASLTILLLPMSSLFDGFQTESSTAKDSSSDKSRGVAVEADGGVTETHTHATPRNSIS